MTNILYKEESYSIIGVLFEVYNNLGSGFSEIVYKDAIEYEFKSLNIPFEREKEYSVNYKDTVLSHKFYADFIVYNKIILELKCAESLHDKHISQCLNYLKVSKNKLAILGNFHKDGLKYKRIIF
ncbi:GxxExxY protein [Hyunsoonleella ulvae]|uniref:GxxExxY protein n=1 Tax=Hyunsoonleella ulvae TaxID=2799948 RepID=UPI00193ACFDE|nr:GxxExxY protein [Hyunsoonleella ulvae]